MSEQSLAIIGNATRLLAQANTSFMEFGDRIFVFIELKYGGGEVRGGQRLAFERLVDAVAATGRHAIFIVARHGIAGKDSGQIDAAKCPVTEYRVKGQWRRPGGSHTLKDIVDKFIEHCHAQPQGE